MWSMVEKKSLSLDSFGTKVELNINGETEIRSWPGMIMSLILYVILLIYAI